MVNKTDGSSKYKNYNRGTHSHNSSTKGYNKFKSDRTPESRGLFQYIFSLQGVMSRDLFAGFMPFIFIITLGIQSLSLIDSLSKVASYTIGIIYLIFVWLTVTTAYKRAHALGISGWYSIIGVALNMPFFYFNRQDNEYIHENVKGCSFKFFKSIGAFLNKNLFIKFLYILCIYAIVYSTNRNKDILVFVLGIASFNMLQLIFGFRKFFVKYYKNIVKVSSFISYNIVILSIGMVLGQLLFLVQLQSQTNFLNNKKQELILPNKTLIKK